MVNMYIHVVPAKIMLYISMETGPATLSPVAEVEPCSTSAFWSRRPPATPCDSTATGRGAVVGRWSLRFWYCESALRPIHNARNAATSDQRPAAQPEPATAVDSQCTRLGDQPPSATRKKCEVGVQTRRRIDMALFSLCATFFPPCPPPPPVEIITF